MNRFVFLISTQRSGTKLFQSILNTSSQVKCYGEIFHPLAHEQKSNFWYFKKNILSDEDRKIFAVPTQENLEKILLLFLEYLESITAQTDSYILCDVMYNSSMVLTPVWHEIRRSPFLVNFLRKKKIPVIHLIRRNLLESYCSAERAKTTKIFHSTDPSVNNQLINLKLDIDKASRAICSKMEEITLFRLFFEKYSNYLEIFYPDFFTEEQDLSESVRVNIKNLLKLSTLETSSSTLVKTSPSLDKYIENYTEVISALTKNKISYILEQ